MSTPKQDPDQLGDREALVVLVPLLLYWLAYAFAPTLLPWTLLAAALVPAWLLARARRHQRPRFFVMFGCAILLCTLTQASALLDSIDHAGTTSFAALFLAGGAVGCALPRDREGRRSWRGWSLLLCGVAMCGFVAVVPPRLAMRLDEAIEEVESFREFGGPQVFDYAFAVRALEGSGVELDLSPAQRRESLQAPEQPSDLDEAELARGLVERARDGEILRAALAADRLASRGADEALRDAAPLVRELLVETYQGVHHPRGPVGFASDPEGARDDFLFSGYVAGTLAAIELMARFGVPEEVDLDRVARYLLAAAVPEHDLPWARIDLAAAVAGLARLEGMGVERPRRPIGVVVAAALLAIACVTATLRTPPRAN